MVQTSKSHIPHPPKSTPLILPFRRVDFQLNCVKGGGACHLREKVLAEAANTCAHFSILWRLLLLNIFHKLHPRRGLSKKRPIPWHQCIYFYWDTFHPGIIPFSSSSPKECLSKSYHLLILRCFKIWSIHWDLRRQHCEWPLRRVSWDWYAFF